MRTDDGREDVSEQELTRALIEVAVAQAPEVHFTQGHGEARFDDDGPDGLTIASDGLTADGYRNRAVSLLDADPSGSQIGVPDEVQLVTQPSQGFDAEVAALEERLQHTLHERAATLPRISR